MRRSLVLLLLFILIGAAINIPLAIHFLHSRTAPRAPTLVNDFGPQAAAHDWPAPTPHDTPWPAPTQWQMEGSLGYRNIQVYGWNGSRSNPTDRVQMQVERMGWPLPALQRVQMWWPWDDPNWQSNAESDPALQLVWTGVVLNPLLLGVTLWLVLVLPFVVFINVRRRLRIAHNCCPKCAYSCGSSQRCSECGYELRPPPTETAPKPGPIARSVSSRFDRDSR